jgi:hypothetical protein
MPLIVSVNLPPILRQNGNHTPFATGDRQFESISLQRRVACEPEFSRGWDPEFESALLQRGVSNEPSRRLVSGRPSVAR